MGRRDDAPQAFGAPRSCCRRRRSRPPPALLLAIAPLLFLLLPGFPASTAAMAVPPDTVGELTFRDKVDAALGRVRTLLDQTRSPRIKPASSVDHAYDDKYALTEFVTNSAIAAAVNVLERMGLDGDRLAELREGTSDGKGGSSSVTLRFEAAEDCIFVEEKVVEVSSPARETYETTYDGESRKVTEEKKTSTKIVREIATYHWNYTVNYSLVAFVGPDGAGGQNAEGGGGRRVVLKERRSGTERIAVSGSKRSPLALGGAARPPLDLDLTWLLRQLGSNDGGGGDEEAGDVAGTRELLLSRFKIDRDVDSCRTPRRNDDVDGAAAFFDALLRWGSRVGRYLQYDVPRQASTGNYRAEDDDEPGGRTISELLAPIDDAGVLMPVLPVFEESDDNDASPLLSAGDVQLFLDEQCRSLDLLLADFENKFPPPQDGQTLASSSEASLILLARHAVSISTMFNEGINSVEGMLRSQLVAAIGKEVAPADFDEFVRSYYPKLLRKDYVPEPFIYSIRRPNHYPDGTLAIEAANGGEKGDSPMPIVTTTRKVEGAAPMKVPINAATTVEFVGDRYLHAWVRNDFRGDLQSGGINLVARARQFSSFLLVVGNIAGPDTFQPSHAIILQNKDEVLLPLLLEQLPTPKEFKDAIQSLSPEQRAFATAFRNMQLESSVFGVLVIQLKPQLENVLGIPYDSLTKEIRLTQDLLSLFIEHQIPSDLLTYDGDAGASVADKIARVKTHVSSVQEMISDAKKKELEEAKMETDMRAEMKYQAEYGDEEVEEDSVHDKMFRASASSAAMPRNGRMARRLHPQMQQAGIRAELMESAPVMMMMAADSGSESMPHLRKAAVPPTGQTEEAPRFTKEDVGEGEGAFVGNSVDFTLIPKQLDAKFEALDKDSALRPTKIKTGDIWTKRYQKSLLTTSLQTKSLDNDDQKAEKDKAFDLLDALSKSGALPIEYAELHVMVAATHGFDKTLIDTIVVDNVNPIEKIERSLLIVSSTINDVPVAELLNKARVSEIAEHSPALLEAPAANAKKGNANGEEWESTFL